MLKINTARAVAMENLGQGKFEVRLRAVYFVGNDGRSAAWGPFPSKTLAQTWLGSVRRSFSASPEAFES